MVMSSRLFVASAITALFVAASALRPATGSAGGPGLPGRFAFEWSPLQPDANAVVWGIATAGPGDTNVRIVAPGLEWPRWSNSGTQIAAVSESDPVTSMLWTMNPDGSGLQAVISDRTPLDINGFDVEDARFGPPTWSPDGKRLAVAKWIDFVDEARPMLATIRIVRVAGGQPRVLAGGHDPVWAPRGGRIAFLRNRRIFTVRSDGRNRTSIASVGVEARLWGIAPDGRRLLFTDELVKKRHAWWRVRVLDLVTHTVIASDMLPSGRQFTGACWSPDGRRIATSEYGVTAIRIRPASLGAAGHVVPLHPGAATFAGLSWARASGVR
jgi:dipeptidyl aminopeptidase/acylaminoacyl peptidase